jgi:serine kinase
MELASHGDLLDYIKLFGYLLEDKARYMFKQVVSAIEYLHSLNIIHRLKELKRKLNEQFLLEI